MNLHYHLGKLIAFILRPLFLSYRYEVQFDNPADAKILFPTTPTQSPLVYAFFHQHEFGLMPFFFDKKIVAIVSQSKDGSLLAGAMEYFGFLTVRGSSHRGGNEAFHEALKQLKNGYSICVAVDGPKGPIYKVKHGAVTLSQRSQVPIIPLSANPNKAHHFLKSWEKSYLPFPFSKIKIQFGKIKYYEIEELESALIRLNSIHH